MLDFATLFPTFFLDCEKLRSLFRHPLFLNWCNCISLCTPIIWTLVKKVIVYSVPAFFLDSGGGKLSSLSPPTAAHLNRSKSAPKPRKLRPIKFQQVNRVQNDLHGSIFSTNDPHLLLSPTKDVVFGQSKKIQEKKANVV